MKIAAAAVRRGLLLAGCGGDDTGTVSSSPNPSPSKHSAASRPMTSSSTSR